MTRDQFVDNVESSQESFRRYLTALCCGDVSMADDLAQESYIKAYLSCDNIRDAARFRAWLFRIGHNTFINSCRTHQRVADYAEVTEVPAEERTDASFRYQHLYQALEKIPAQERSAILLYYMQGYSIKEIAAITGASADAVRQHLSRGRRHLHGFLGSPPAESGE